MTFITLLLCLSLERFIHKDNLLARFTWFEIYVNKINQLTNNQAWAQHNYISLLLVILPIVIIVAFVYFLSALFVHGLLSFLIGAFVLFYCLGPMNIYDTDKIHPQIFWQANQALFAVIFWFTLLGPIAALVYRLIERSAYTRSSSYPTLAKVADQAQAIIDWLPVRFFSMLFALAGNFIRTSQMLLNYLFKSIDFNCELIEKTGVIALNLDEMAELSSADYSQALNLIDRSLVIFLIIVFAVTLGILL